MIPKLKKAHNSLDRVVKSFNKKGSLVLSTFFHFFSVYPFLFVFNLCSSRVVHDLLEAVAVRRTDEARGVEIDYKVFVHRARLVAAPVSTDATDIRHQNREVLVTKTFWFKHTVAETSMLQALVVFRTLVPKCVCLHPDVFFAFLVVSGTIWFKMSSLTTVSTAPLRSQSL